MVKYLSGNRLDFSKEMLFMLMPEEYMLRTEAACPGEPFRQGLKHKPQKLMCGLCGG